MSSTVFSLLTDLKVRVDELARLDDKADRLIYARACHSYIDVMLDTFRLLEDDVLRAVEAGHTDMDRHRR